MTARRRWGWPLVPLYATGLAVKDFLRRSGFLRTHALRWPVISVGSLSAGGAGKTPVVIALAELLGKHGWGADVISRGYGRREKGVARVEPAEFDAAGRFGDEPVLIARRARVPVWVGESRFAAGNAAESSAGRSAVPRRVHLLDDGFQHRQLERTLDIVVVTAKDLADALLPAGNRREPLSALRRADLILVREDEAAGIEAFIQPLIGADTPFCALRRRLRFPKPAGVLSAGLRPVAFCAIARPESFATMLVEAGCGIVETVAFSDHQTISPANINDILDVARRLSASGFVTTEKDAVKLSNEDRARLRTLGPIMVVALDVEFVDPAALLGLLESQMDREPLA